MESFNNFIEQVRLDEALDETTTGELIRRLVLAPKMKKIVRFYLDWRRKNPGQGNRGIQKVIQIMGLNPRDGNQLILTLNKLVDKGDLPKHLRINIPNLESFLEKACWDSHKQVGMKKKGNRLVPNCVPKEEVNEGSETWEKGYPRRVVKTTEPEHKEKGYNWRIKGKDKSHLTIKLYKDKPSFKEFTKQMKRVAGHEFGG